jgi:hypothetical protein
MERLKIFLMICLASYAFADAQTSSKGAGSDSARIQSPTSYCCDNRTQAEGQWAESPSTVQDYSNCPHDIDINVRDCVNRTRDARLCLGSEGARYCRENSNPNFPYPRYYALDQPIGTSPGSLNFAATYGGSNPPPQTFSISNNPWIVFGLDYTLNWSGST